MNKEQAYTDAVAADRHVCNKHSFDAGWDAAIEELAKVSEPVATVIDSDDKESIIDVSFPVGTPVYVAQLPQPDLVAEIESLKADLENERMRLAACGVAALGYFEGCNDEYKSASLNDTLRLYAENTELRQQLSAAQASESELVKALNNLIPLAKVGNYDGRKEITDAEALAAHKARQRKEQS